MRSARKKCWSYIAGERGRNWVRAFEKQPGGILFVEWYEPVPGRTKPRRKRASLGHRDRTKAKTTADEIAAAFARKEVPEPLKREPGDITFHKLLRSLLGAGDALQGPEQAGTRPAGRGDLQELLRIENGGQDPEPR